MKTIVVSAVNLRKGGTLTILRDCLRYLSGIVAQGSGEYRVVALVHDRKLCDYPGIEYMEMPRCICSWAHRLWVEYVTMHRISREIASEDGRTVWLWLSLHDTTPRVEAEHRQVYCHTSFPFLKVRLRDWLMDPKIPLFAHFTKWAYRINAGCNETMIVQQNWFADALSKLVRLPRSRFTVLPPDKGFYLPILGVPPVEAGRKAMGPAIPDSASAKTRDAGKPYTFFYASTPDCHKNFEAVCEAARRLEKDGVGFRLVITVKGDENRYGRWLRKRWGDVSSIDFHGFMSKEELYANYMAADCFVFPSRIETWGLPVSEYASVNPSGGLILADLPYAHETAGERKASYFDPDNVESLKKLMNENIAAR